MFEAIASLVAKTIDIYLKANSPEVRRRKIFKRLVVVYQSLGDISDGINRIAETVDCLGRAYSGENDYVFHYFVDRASLAENRGKNINPGYLILDGYSIDGTCEFRTIGIDRDGHEIVSPTKRIHYRNLLPALLSSDIRLFKESVFRIAEAMESEASDIYPGGHIGRRLAVLEIFDVEMASTFHRAWYGESAFVECLCHLGLYHDIDEGIISIFDAQFDPTKDFYDLEYALSEVGLDNNSCSLHWGDLHRKQYVLTNPGDVKCFMEMAHSHSRTIMQARELVRRFIASNCSIEDVL